MLERLRGEVEEMDGPTAGTLIGAFADGLDAMLPLPEVQNWTPIGWRGAERLMPSLAPKVRASNPSLLVESFKRGQALSWLTNLLRDELAARGRFGDRVQGTPFLTDTELAEVEKAMVARYRALGLEAIFKGERPGWAMYAWRVIDEAHLCVLVQDLAKSDDGLLRSLQALAGRVRTSGSSVSDREFATLKEETVSPFLDYKEVRDRVSWLAKAPGPLASDAAHVLQFFENGDHF